MERAGPVKVESQSGKRATKTGCADKPCPIRSGPLWPLKESVESQRLRHLFPVCCCTFLPNARERHSANRKCNVSVARFLFCAEVSHGTFPPLPTRDAGGFELVLLGPHFGRPSMRGSHSPTPTPTSAPAPPSPHSPCIASLEADTISNHGRYTYRFHRRGQRRSSPPRLP